MVGPDSWIAVYIMASARNGTLYTGVTSALVTRVQKHKLGAYEGFSKDNGCKTLVWYEPHATMPEAIQREKLIKRWRRDWKLALIEAENPHWRDVSEEWFEIPEGPLSWTQRLWSAVARPGRLGPGSARSASAPSGMTDGGGRRSATALYFARDVRAAAEPAP